MLFKLRTHLYVAAILVVTTFASKAQTLFVPNGTTGVSTSTNANVGVGIATPTEKFEVSGNLSVLGNLYFKNGIRKMGTTTNHDLQFITNNTERMLLKNDGKIFFRNRLYMSDEAAIIYGNTTDEDKTRLIISFNPTSHSYITFKDNLHFRANKNWISPLIVQGDGNVAIGYQTTYTTDGTQYQTQGHKLAIKGSVLIEDGALNLSSGMNAAGPAKFTGNVGIGIDTPTEKLDVAGNFSLSGNVLLKNDNRTIGTTTNHSLTFTTNNLPRFTIMSNGNVGVGVENTGEYKLAVGGKIIAEELVVKLQGDWPDYVFSPNFKLKPLEEVEDFIVVNGHLPEVPSAKEVEENGVSVGEMNAILLKKVEELTVYAIELNKTLRSLEEKVKSLESTNN